LRRFSVDEYHSLIAQGYFAHDERFELLEGLIVHKMSRDPLHDAYLAQGRRLLNFRLPAGWHIRVQSAVTTLDSEPEPDLAVVRGTELDYLSHHPGPAEVSLIVEVSNTSLTEDRNWKGMLYARAGFEVYWILNLNHARIEVYSDPSGPDADPTYRRRQDYGIGQLIPLTIDGIAVAPVPVAELLPTAVQPQQP